MKTIWICLTGTALLSTVVAACSDANDTTDGGGTQIPYDAGHDAAAPGVDAGTGTSTMDAHQTMPTSDTGATVTPDGSHVDTGATSPSDAAVLAVVINEVNGKESDYVELFNAGNAPVALDGWGVSEAKHDDAGDPGTPKSPVTFPAGTTLAAGAYALILGAPKDGGTTLTPCPGSVCLQATWNISNSSGSTVYLTNASMASVATASLPGGATGSGQSWGRLPNGSGTFQLNTQTPGAANTGP